MEEFTKKILQEEKMKTRLKDLKRDIQREWFIYRNHEEILHDCEIKDNGLNMILVYLLKKGVL